MRFEVKKKLSTQSERVKSIEFHPELPWIVSAMYTGNVTIYDYTNQVDFWISQQLKVSKSARAHVDVSNS